MKSLFYPIAKGKKLNKSFQSINKYDGYEPGKLMMNDIFQKFIDIDGNFIEQFQTTGFDQRVFELYLYAYFIETGFEVLRNYDRPDFIIKKNDKNIAIEATTANESSTIPSKEFSVLSYEEKQDYLTNEIPIRLGSPLFTKLQKQYWKLQQCQGLPFIIAIESFYNNESLLFSSSSLSTYLYGFNAKPTYNKDGILKVNYTPLNIHSIGSKEIPSAFFNQPETENVSAIIFTNSGTVPKFCRMGYYKGYYSNPIKMIRNGNCYDYDSNASLPKNFTYDIDDTINTPLMESWGQGIEIFHNPNAKIPLSRGLFKDAAEHYLENGILYSDIPKPFHPFTSVTNIILDKKNFYYNKKLYKKITLFEFDNLLKMPERKLSLFKEIAWLRSLDFSIIMCIIFDSIDYDYGYAIYKKSNDLYEFEDANNSFKTIEGATKSLFIKVNKLIL